MTDKSVAVSLDPLHAPLWRKLLAIRVFVLCCIVLALSLFIIQWFYTAKPDIPKWVEMIVIILAVPLYLGYFVALKQGIADLIVHFIPDGRARRFLLWEDKPAEIIAAEFRETGYAIALAPLFFPVGLAVPALVVYGGIALVGSLFSAMFSMFSGWPSWAIVIILLLVAILLKVEK